MFSLRSMVCSRKIKVLRDAAPPTALERQNMAKETVIICRLCCPLHGGISFMGGC